MPPWAFGALMNDAGTICNSVGTPLSVRLSEFVALDATLKATAALPIVPVYVPAGSDSASWQLVPPGAGEQPVAFGPTVTLCVMLVGPLTLIASTCVPLPAGAPLIAGGGGAVVTGTAPPKGCCGTGDGIAGSDGTLESAGLL